MIIRYTHREYVIEENSKYGTLSQVLRRAVQVVEHLLDGGYQAIHDIVLVGVKLCQCAMGQCAGPFV